MESFWHVWGMPVQIVLAGCKQSFAAGKTIHSEGLDYVVAGL